MTEILTYANSAILALFLIAGGWVKIRNYFRDKAQANAEALEAAAQVRESEIEAEVQKRLKRLQGDTDITEQPGVGKTESVNADADSAL